jgi:hypothetical protein
MGEECIEIVDCPKCHRKHRYKLAVERSVVLKMLTMSDMNEPPRHVRFTRLFTCPVKKEDFQATMILTDSSSDRIKDVKVLRVATDDEQ